MDRENSQGEVFFFPKILKVFKSLSIKKGSFRWNFFSPPLIFFLGKLGWVFIPPFPLYENKVSKKGIKGKGGNLKTVGPKNKRRVLNFPEKLGGGLSSRRGPGARAPLFPFKKNSPFEPFFPAFAWVFPAVFF